MKNKKAMHKINMIFYPKRHENDFRYNNVINYTDKEGFTEQNVQERSFHLLQRTLTHHTYFQNNTKFRLSIPLLAL